MDGVKSFFRSKTIYGAVIAVLPQVVGLLGVDFSASDANEFAKYIEAIVTGFGGLLAIYGRVTAKERLSV